MKRNSIWDDPRTRAALTLGYEGRLTLRTIGRLVDLSEGQVWYRFKKHGISTTLQRHCQTPLSRQRAITVLKQAHLPLPQWLLRGKGV